MGGAAGKTLFGLFNSFLIVFSIVGSRRCGVRGCCRKNTFQSILAHDEIHDVLLMDHKHTFLEMMLATRQQGQRKGGGRRRCRKSTFYSLSSLSSSVSLRSVCSLIDNDNNEEVSRERYSKKFTFDLFSHFPAAQIQEIDISCIFLQTK